MVSLFRETVAEMWRGRSIENVWLYFGGYDEGGYLSPNIDSLPISVPMALQSPHVGIRQVMVLFNRVV